VSIPCFAIDCLVFSMRARYSGFSNGSMSGILQKEDQALDLPRRH